VTGLLLRRELRRQLPVALASAGLGLLALLVLRLGARLVLHPIQVADLGPFVPQLALILVGLVTPWLLGVSSLAPDIESGAAAFLSALPVRRERLTLARLAVATALTLAVVAPFAAYALVSYPPRLGGRDAAEAALMVLTLGLTPLVAGALMGLVTGRSLPAFAATPILLACLSVAATGIVVGFSAFGELTSFATVASIPLLVVALVLVGVRRGVGVRPGDGLRFGVAALAALLLTTGGLGGVALAVGTATNVYHHKRWSRRGPLVVWEDVHHRPIYPNFSDGEVVAFPLAAVPSWVRGERPVGRRLGPLDVPVDLSPDGRRLLAYDGTVQDGSRLVVVDMASGEEVLRRDGDWSYQAPSPPGVEDGFVDGHDQGWRRGVPVCVDTWSDPAGGSLVTLDGTRLPSPIASSRVTSVRGGWALLAAPGGLHAWDLDAGSCPRRWPEAVGGRLVGDGLAAILEPGSALRLVRLEDGATTLRASLGDLAGVTLDVEPAPGGGAALVWRRVDLDPSDPREKPLLVVGASATPLAWHDARRTAIFWSPDGQRVAFTELGVVDVARPAELHAGGLGVPRPHWGVQLLGFADSRTLLTEDEDALWAVDVDTGARRPVPHPLPPLER